MSKKQVLSSEIGAIAPQAYQTRWKDLLKVSSARSQLVRSRAYEYLFSSIQSAHASFAGGINQFTWHGYTYSGTYGLFPKTPGWEAWFYLFSEAHGPRQPAWEYIRSTM